MMDSSQVKSKLDLHEYRLDRFETLMQEHNKELRLLREAQNSFEKKLNDLTNRILLAFVAITLAKDPVTALFMKILGV